MVKRKVVIVDEEKCDGCGICIPNCAEGALKIVNGKLSITEGLCDGLGACIGVCPKGALTIVEKETEKFTPPMTVSQIKEHGTKKTRVHLEKAGFHVDEALKNEKHGEKSSLTQWPIKLELVNPSAPFLRGSELLVVADCVPFAYGNFHRNFLEGKKIVTGCPKFGNIDLYLQKLVEILKNSNIKNIEVVRMEVPCCSGLKRITEEAVKRSGRNIQVKESIIGIDGKRLVATRGMKCCD